MGRYLIILACSDKKKKNPGLLPAIERYDGYFFKIIKKMMRNGKFPSSVDILILSAEYGLIKPDTLIRYYDRRMDKRRAMELRPKVMEKLKEIAKRYDEIFVCLGKDYLECIRGIENFANVKYANGKIGEKGRELKEWLRSIKIRYKKLNEL